MNNKRIKNVNRILSIFILVFSPFFIYATSVTFMEGGGAMGFGYLLVPFFILGNLFIVPAIISLFKNNLTNTFYFLINIVGSIYTILFLVLLI